MKSVRIALIGAMALMSTSAFAGAKVGLHYMPSFTLPMTSGVSGLGALNPLGVGASFNYMFGATQMFGFHLEGAYTDRNLTSTVRGAGIYSAVGPRFTIKNVLSFFAGAGYYLATTPMSAPNNALPNSFLISGGFDVDVPVAKMVALTFGGRYIYPFSDVRTGVATVNPSQIMAQVGIRFGQFGK